MQKASPLQRAITPRMQTPPEQLKENGNYTVEQKPPKQLDLFEENLLKREIRAEYRLIGQVLIHTGWYSFMTIFISLISMPHMSGYL